LAFYTFGYLIIFGKDNHFPSYFQIFSFFSSLHVEIGDAENNLSAKIDYCLWYYKKKSVTLQQLFY
jgi:hypothetical protein